MPSSKISSGKQRLRHDQYQNNFLQQLADFTPDLLFVIDLSSRDVLYVNSRIEQLLGHNASYMYENGPLIFEKLVHPQDYERRMANLDACKKLGDHQETAVEVRLKSASGSWNWFRIREKVFKRDTHGQVLQVMGIAQNIHEQRTAGEKLQEEHRRFKDAQSIGHIGSYIRDLPGDTLYCSEEFFRIHGIEPQAPSISFEECMSFVHPDDQEATRAAIRQTHETGEALDLVNRIVRPDGSTRFIHRRALLIQNDKGEPERIYGTIQDITEHKEAEQEVIALKEKLAQQATDQYRTLFSSIDEGFCILEVIFSEEKEPSADKITDYRFIDANPAFERQTGIRKAAGRSIRELLPDTPLSRFEQYGRVALERKTVRFRDYIEPADRWFDVNTFPAGPPENRQVAVLLNDITRRRQHEEGLQRSKERLQKALSIETVGIVFFDLEGRLNDANKAFQEMSGYSHADFINGKVRWDRATPPEFMEVTLKARDELLSTGQNVPYEKQYTRPDGSRWWGLFAGKRLSESEYVGFVVDISRQKEAEQQLKNFNSRLEQQVAERTHALQESKNLLQAVLNGAPSSISSFKPLLNESGEVVDMVYQTVNKQTEAISGLPAKKLIGKRFLELYPHAKQNGIFDQFLRVMETGEPYMDELCFQHPEEGMSGYFLVSLVREGEALVWTVLDISARRKAEIQLEENALFIRKVADTTPDILFVYNLEQMRLQYINRDLYSLLGKSLETLRAMTPEVLFSLLHPEEREAAQAFTHSFENASDEELKEIVLRLQNRQKEWRWFHCRTRVFKRNREGRVVQLLSIMRDVTEEKNTTEALVEAEKLSVKGTMARTIAHEVRGPAANITLSMEMLRQELEQELEGREDALMYFHIVSKSCNRITSYINELLNISHHEPDAYIECDLAMIAEEVLSKAQDRIFLKEIKVERHFRKGIMIHAERERLKVALLNIIMNAIEAMEEQKGVLQLFIRRQNNKVSFIVQDNGCGMTDEQLSRMFDSHYTSKPKGLGVGLANVKTILQDHGAGIKVESEAGKGTVFTVTFSAHT